MTDRRRNDVGVIFAIVLIAVGAWLLLGNVLGEAWRPVARVVRFLGQIGWPLALIAIGVLLLLAAQGRFSTAELRGRRLYRSRTDRMVAGVLGGLADIIGIDATILRIVYVIFGFASGFGAVLLYIAAVVLIPEAPVAQPQAPVWPTTTGRETVQTPPPAPPVPEAPTPPVPPADPSQSGPSNPSA